MKSLFLCLLISFFSFACHHVTNNSSQESSSTSDSALLDAAIEAVTISEEQELQRLADSAYKNDPRTKAYVDVLKQQWVAVPKTINATYIGAEFGDYFHLVFETQTEQILDFGDARNEYGEYNLILESNNQNNDYIGKNFEITWDWLPSSFYCCEGNMDNMIANIPTIIHLKLTE